MTTTSLPDFPWDSLVPSKNKASEHPDGLLDFSVGSPADPTPEFVTRALVDAAQAPAYPQTQGTPELREAIVDWFRRRRGVNLDVEQVIPTIGSKEFIAGLPQWLGLSEGDAVVHPKTAYPTYAVGALLVGAQPLALDDPAEWPENTRLVWLNSPGNPDGRVLSIEQLRAAVARARELGAVIVGDECYAEFDWTAEAGAQGAAATTPSILHPDVTGGDARGVLAAYSLSKQSNLAGYRAGFVGGDAEVIATVLGVRKHVGLMVPTPVQAAMVAVLRDEEHVNAQRERYRMRRDVLQFVLERAGFRIDESRGGLYLWAAWPQGADAAVAALADKGILVAPGTFYTDDEHVRIALTASDETVAAAAERLFGGL